jgi:hypothetical protein
MNFFLFGPSLKSSGRGEICELRNVFVVSLCIHLFFHVAVLNTTYLSLANYFGIDAIVIRHYSTNCKLFVISLLPPEFDY